MAYTGLVWLAAVAFLPLPLYFYLFFHQKSKLPTNWPLVGMLLPLFWNMNRIQDYITEFLEESKGHFLFHGPWFSNMKMLFVADPTDIHYIMSKNFSNYAKGPEFKRIFDILGEGIFNVDDDLWKFQRQMAHSFIGHDRFRRFLMKTVCQKIENGLIPILDHVAEQGVVVDLQDLFERLTLDSMCFFITGRDPGSLTFPLKEVPLAKALADGQEAVFLRHALPESVWRLFRKLNIGTERKLIEAWKVIDQFLYSLIEEKKQNSRNGINSPLGANREDDEGVDLLTLYMGSNNEANKHSDKFLRDTAFSLLMAGRDTTSAALSWLFWLLTSNPESESKIIEEVKAACSSKGSSSDVEIENLSKMVYLHGAMCESLRLYPPVAINHKAPLISDTLPSGHKVDPNTKILFPIYSMGRAKSIWGEDCMEFKPERWISEQGKLKKELPHKFFSFGAGPRICIGKDISFLQMKAVVSSLIGKYQFQVMEGHNVVPNQKSVILHMKNGLKVRVLKRCQLN